MLPQSEFESPMLASAPAPVAIAAITQDRALIGLLRSVIDPTNDLILVTSEAELTPHLNSRRVSVALLDSMFIEGDLAAMAERLRETWPDLVLVVVGTAEEQSKVAGQITSGVVYRFLHRPVSAPRVRLFVDAALRRHEVENVERTLEQMRPDFSQARSRRSPKSSGAGTSRRCIPGIVGAGARRGRRRRLVRVFSGGKSRRCRGAPAAQVVSPPAEAPAAEPAAAEAARAEPRRAARRPRSPAPQPPADAAPAPAPARRQPQPAADVAHARRTNPSATACAPPPSRAGRVQAPEEVGGAAHAGPPPAP